MASHNGEIDYKPHPDPPLAGPSTSKDKPHENSDLGQEGPNASGPGPGPGTASGLTEDIEMDEMEQMRERECERLLTGENKPNRLEGKLTSSFTSNSTSTEPTSAYHRMPLLLKKNKSIYCCVELVTIENFPL